MITPINNITSNYKPKNYVNSVNKTSFKGRAPIQENFFFRSSEYAINSLAILKRKIYNQIKNRGRQDKLFEFYNKIINLPEDSHEFMMFFHNYARKFGKNREVEINLESNRLLEIAKSDEACIFIMSHSDGKKDPAMLGILGSLLSGAYINLGKSKFCPRAKIIVNEDILTSMNRINREIYEKFGAVGINANLFQAGKGKNKEKIKALINNFNQNKNHIFIFPEGKMGMFKDLDLKDKFQPGVGSMVKYSLLNKQQVKVVPVGFAYNYDTEKFLGSIYVGEPIYFIKDKGSIAVNQANIDQGNATQSYKDFFDLTENDSSHSNFKVITSNGKPVPIEDQTPYISGILCENLRICTMQAKVQLPLTSEQFTNIITI